MNPDLVHSELRPHRDLGILGGVPLELHDLDLGQQLLQEVEGAVVLLGQHEALQRTWSEAERALTLLVTRYLYRVFLLLNRLLIS